jgi:hypothetical protein
MPRRDGFQVPFNFLTRARDKPKLSGRLICSVRDSL